MEVCSRKKIEIQKGKKKSLSPSTSAPSVAPHRHRILNPSFSLSLLLQTSLSVHRAIREALSDPSTRSEFEKWERTLR